MAKDNHTSIEPADASQAKDINKPFVIVGIGASAGGLEALNRLFSAMPDEPGMAFVVIQHLDPTRQSLTSELLGKHTSMRVTQVEDEPHVAPNRVYVIPPNKYLSISQGTLHLSEPEHPRASRMAIDHFLRSLAKDQQQRAVAIILSGTGADGTLGVKAVKANGGFVIAQDPDSADHAGMPRGAIATKLVDCVLPPEEMAETLISFARHPYIYEPIPNEMEGESGGETNSTVTEPAASPDTGVDLSSILSLLRARTQIDFHNYKDKTLMRRTRRRMCLHQITEYSDYHELLRENPAEVEALVRDLLIAVTDFFRDGEAWKILEEQIVPEIVTGKSDGQPIRVWTPGCATGEEPYSLAMLLMEELRRNEKDCPLQIFASDIDKEVLAQARAGRYPASIASDVSPERLKRFFTHSKEDGHHYYVSKPLREAVVFAEQNLIADPPFSKLDLICCRNLLIYLKAEIQEKVISLFHFALGEGGILFLGNSETVGRHSELFETIDKRWRLFRSRRTSNVAEFPISATSGQRRSHLSNLARPRPVVTRLPQLAEQQLLELLAPAAVVVDREWRIQYIAGDVDDYLTHAPGVPNDDLLQKCRRGLRSKTRGAVQRALTTHQTVTVSSRVQRDGKYHDVRLVVRPFTLQEEDRELALLVFEAGNQQRSGSENNNEAGKQETGERNSVEADIDGDLVIRQLEDELATTKEDLQHTLEQSESSQEELKASNEEVMSINEELQSTNEELETSKEELESLNEELSTVNHQLAGKVEELETKHADLENLIAATEMATICLDTEMHIRWFTPAAKGLFRLGSSDHGRPISDLSHDFTENNLVQVAQQVFDKLSPLETEVVTSDDRYFLRRVTPYRSGDHRISGVVITFVDITNRKRDELEQLYAKQLSDTIIDSAPLPILALDGKLRVQRANEAFYERFQVPASETMGRLVYELGNGQWDIPRLRELLERILPEKEVFENYEVRHDFESIGFRIMLLNARRIDHQKLILLSIEDVTEPKQKTAKLAKLNESLEKQVEERVQMLAILQDAAIASNEGARTEDAMQAILKRICDFNHWVMGHAYRRDAQNPDRIVSAGIWYINQDHCQESKLLEQLHKFQKQSDAVSYERGEGVIGRVYQSGHPIWVEDFSEFDGFQVDPRLFGLSALIAFPVKIDGEVGAVLECLSDRAIEREPMFMDIMLNVGIQLGHVMERNRLELQIANSSEIEQRRIGSDMHDGVGQELSGLRYPGSNPCRGTRRRLLARNFART